MKKEFHVRDFFRWVDVFLGALLIISIFLPHISFGLNDMDSQPWALVLAFIYILLNINFSLPAFFYPFLILPFFVLVLILFGGQVDFASARALASYSSISLIFISSYIYLRKYSLPVYTLFFINAVYLLSGVFQLIFSNEIFSFLVSSRTTDDRGVTGLSVEPTYYAFILFFFSWIYFVACNYKLYGLYGFLIILNFMGILFLAKSSIIVLFVLIFLVCLLFRGISFLSFLSKFFIIFMFGLLVFFMSLEFLSDSRLGSLIAQLFDQGLWGVVKGDASINDRVSAVVFPFHGLIENYFLPGGFHSYGQITEELHFYYDGFFWQGGSGNTIMSYWGAMVYELGFLGVIWALYLLFIIGGVARQRFESFLLFLFLFSAIPVGFSIVSFFFALCMLKGRLRNY